MSKRALIRVRHLLGEKVLKAMTIGIGSGDLFQFLPKPLGSL